MKTVMKHFFCMALIGTMVVSCGKDESKGGGSSSSSSYNPYTGYVPSTSQTAFQNLTSWYNSTTEGSTPAYYGTFTEYRTIKIYNANNGCQNKQVSVFGINLGSIQFCSSSSSTASTTTQTNSVTTVAGQAKSSSARLAAAIAGTGTLVNLTESSAYGGVSYTLTYQKSNGHTVIHVINTNIHSAFNPVYSYDSETRREDTLVNIY